MDAQLCIVFRVSGAVDEFEILRLLFPADSPQFQNFLAHLFLIFVGDKGVEDFIVFDIINEDFFNTFIIILLLFIRERQVISKSREFGWIEIFYVSEKLGFVEIYDAILFADFNNLHLPILIFIENPSQTFFD